MKAAGTASRSQGRWPSANASTPELLCSTEGRWKNNPELSAAITGHTAQQRWGAPTDLAGAYQFLASDASSYVTGTVLSVDGGYLLV